jgi:hypothetical protein
MKLKNRVKKERQEVVQSVKAEEKEVIRNKSVQV